MAIADGFHVDINGNLWLGSDRETFDATTRSEAPFYVYANGDMVANSGTFAGTLSSGISISAPVITGGSISGTTGTFSGDISGASGTFTGDLSGSSISGGSINIGNGTFQVDSSGNLTASSATISGYISAGGAANDINNYSTQINGGRIQANTLDVNSVITNDLDFNNLSISSQNIIDTLVDNAIQDAKIASGLNPSKISGFGAISGNQVVINASNGLAILYGELTMNNRGISNANDIDFNNGSSFDSSGNLFANGTVRSNSYHSATRYYDINSSSNMDLAPSFVYLKPGDNFGLNVSTSTSTIYSTFQPSDNGGKNLGSSTRRWGTVYRIAESSTSDERLKENIIDINYGLDFINDLRPREFTWKSVSSGFSCDVCGQIYESVQECNSEIKSVDENDEEILINCTGTVIEQFTEADDKYTFGFIAQEMLPELGTSKLYNLVNHDTESDEYNYSQENLIAPLVKAVQELSAKNDELESRLAALEG